MKNFAIWIVLKIDVLFIWGEVETTRCAYLLCSGRFQQNIATDYYNIGVSFYRQAEDVGALDSAYVALRDSACFYFGEAWEMDGLNNDLLECKIFEDENNSVVLEIDSDKDGIIDKEDNCPLIFGTDKYCGCPARDYITSVMINNPSFEDLPRNGSPPRGWYDCGFAAESPVDIHPIGYGGDFGVKTKAYEGLTYMGMIVRDNDTWESVGQRLNKPLQKGMKYTLNVALARSPLYESR
ncbi:MAG: hypothetical protein AAGJ12_07625, partial [Bacteroidota bacterium]